MVFFISIGVYILTKIWELFRKNNLKLKSFYKLKGLDRAKLIFYIFMALYYFLIPSIYWFSSDDYCYAKLNPQLGININIRAYLFWIGNNYLTRTLAIILLLGLLFSGLYYFNRKFFE